VQVIATLMEEMDSFDFSRRSVSMESAVAEGARLLGSVRGVRKQILKQRKDPVDGVNTPIEFKRTDVLLLDSIGKGQFGVVHRGSLSVLSGHVKAQIPVAVKMAQGDSSKEAVKAFSAEAAMSWQFVHKNVVGVFGVVTSGFPHLLILELCTNGELLS
jgi:hypothetical protein